MTIFAEDNKEGKSLLPVMKTNKPMIVDKKAIPPPIADIMNFNFDFF